MLLANLAKSPSLQRILYLTRSLPPSTLSTSTLAIDQLLDLFVKENYNPDADYDHLAYLFADLAKYPEGTKYLTTLKSYDNLFPISKLLPFTEVGSLARRLGVASAIKNVAFTIPIHAILMAEPLEILPHILLPLASGADTYTEKETEELPLELQLLDPSVKREDDFNVLKTHLETLLLLTTTKEVREELREKGVYYVIRECHLAVEDEEVREACDRLVQVLMRDDALEDDVQVEIKKGVQAIEDGRRKEESEDEDDDKIVEIF